ncbi:hypothetical protein NDA11_002763 [Ustilago hordei]|uniref:Uncharacterized protein n=1 Tax=Ustilago hordei TaxID=120017 RepID=I2FSW9_USTHO|nr:hypothetical protein NDA10_007878 [Ustilago hordei]KAJ1570695.1 hypothetical protein NDA11_002763 [Ustilago hordei]KAJ1587257.1 hypothetical protein NDA15_003683 [Ustilago hordei]KAJ1590442.1 hypothetical protein NDA12_007355 [Ustilago hordei]UTT96579.1 hypothetical protein NDA17_003167 [Ustilago hordei]
MSVLRVRSIGECNAYTSVLCESGTPAKGLAGVVVLLLTMFGLVTRFPDPVTARTFEEVLCHGPGCSRSRRVTGSYGRSTGIKDLVKISREHGHSAVSMETMDSYGLTCKGGPSTATRRTKLKEQAQPRRGPSSRSMQMVTTQGLERQEPKELSLSKEKEQCRRSRHSSRGTGVPSRRGP